MKISAWNTLNRLEDGTKKDIAEKVHIIRSTKWASDEWLAAMEYLQKLRGIIHADLEDIYDWYDHIGADLIIHS